MNLKEIKEMIGIMNENNLSEFEIEKDGFKIKLKKSSKQELQDEVIITEQPLKSTQAKKKTEDDSETLKLIEIKAPMVGTFYSAPSPESPPYVKRGDSIDLGQVICIIEAMKLMNEIKAEVKGKIRDIVVENGDPIEFGQTLFLVESS